MNSQRLILKHAPQNYDVMEEFLVQALVLEALGLQFRVFLQSISQRSKTTYIRCRSRKCIWQHIPVHAISAIFYIFFLPVLSRLSFTFRTRIVHKKCLAQKVAHFSSLGWIPMIQAPFDSTCAALQWNEVFPSSNSKVLRC